MHKNKEEKKRVEKFKRNNSLEIAFGKRKEIK